MKALIYKLFTQENNIILSSNTLRYLESSIRDEAELRSLVAEYSHQNGPGTGDLEAMKRILESFRLKIDPRRIYDLVPQRCPGADGLKKYKFLREKIERRISPIYLLGEARATIFGCYYRSKSGGEVLEDDGGCIPLDTSGYLGDVFLCEGMFIAAEGRRADGSFLVENIFLPRIEKEARNRQDLAEKECRTLFFSDFEITERNLDVLSEICERHSPDVVVLMGRLCTKRTGVPIKLIERRCASLYGSMHIEIIVCPHPDDGYPSCLPKRILEESEAPNLRVTVNPFLLELKHCSIAVIREDVFRAKERGRFVGGNLVNSFVRSFASQYSFNPFGLAGLNIEKMPDMFVVGQNFDPFVVSADGVLFVSCPSFREEESFVSLHLPSNQAEIIRYGKNAG
jgi:DNA polymerase epsilon subunit 2